MGLNGVPTDSTTSKRKPHYLLPAAILPKREKLRKTIELFKLGHSIREIAVMLGKSREGIRIQLQKEGFLPALSGNSWIPGQKVLRGKGRWNSPYGFKYEQGRAVKHPQEFETLLLIFKMRNSRLSSREIADQLNEQKLRPRMAKQWDRCTVHRIIEWHAKHPNFLQEVLSWESKN